MEFKQTIQKVKNEYDIVDYIKSNGVDLEAQTNGNWLGLCPFHTEKTPSFTVSEGFQSYHCFGCGQSGDILSFAEHTHSIGFLEALKMLAEEKGIEIGNQLTQKEVYDINGIRQVLLDAKNFFRTNYEKLDNSHPAKQEIIKRGLDVNNELYGYSLETPNDLYRHLKTKGHSDDNIRESKLVIFFEDNRPPWDFFHGRLMITLNDYLGRPISFTSRKIYKDDKMMGKYVNGKESPIYYKKSNLFGADLAKKTARETNTIYVVEGQFDQISMYENGMLNVVATSGTAFTAEHANLLLRMTGKSGKIVFIMDGDEAGLKAALSVFTSSKALHSSAYAVLLGEGEDPCDYIVNGGIELLQKEIDKATPIHDFVINTVINDFGGAIKSNDQYKFVGQIAWYAKHSEEKHIIENMLNKASVLSAMAIDNVKDIYSKTAINKIYVKEKEIEQQKLQPKIQLNLENEADLCMFSALALLVRMPNELIPITPEKKENKFHPFLLELGRIYVRSKEANNKWRFIAEDYTDSDFAKALQNKLFLESPEDDVKSSISQYVYLFNKANELYEEQEKEVELAKVFSSIINNTNPKEVAEVLLVYENSLLQQTQDSEMEV